MFAIKINNLSLNYKVMVSTSKVNFISSGQIYHFQCITLNRWFKKKKILEKLDFYHQFLRGCFTKSHFLGKTIVSVLFSITDHKLKLFTRYQLYANLFKIPNNLTYTLGMLILCHENSSVVSRLPHIALPLATKGTPKQNF